MDSTLDQLASASGSKTQDGNIALAQKIVAAGDKSAIKELVAGLGHQKKAIRFDCIKTLYEIAELEPQLLSIYTGVIVSLLEDKDNRMQWGAMHALSAMQPVIQEPLFNVLDKLLTTADSGSVITRDHLIRILAGLSQNKKYAATTLPLLMEQILQAPVNQVPSYAEQALAVTGPDFKDRLVQVVKVRLNDIEQESKKKRVEKVLKKLQ